MKRILLVDDATTVRLFTRSILEPAGYAVEEALNGIEALEKALSTPFDLYLVDINMPMLNGCDFLRTLRQQAMTQQPALMVSTESSADEQATALAAGANGYLIKPVNPVQLLATIGVLLGEVR